MRTIRYILSSFLIAASLLFTVAPVRAQVSNSISGGRSTDYQPQTNNPQSDVGTGVQNTTTGLQPVPGQNNFSQEALTGSGSLQVAGAANIVNPNTTSIPPYKETAKLNPIPIVLIGIVTLAGIVYVVRQPDTKKRQSVKTRLETNKTIVPEPLPTIVSKKTSTAKKGKSTKKKTSKKRKK